MQAYKLFCPSSSAHYIILVPIKLRRNNIMLTRSVCSAVHDCYRSVHRVHTFVGSEENSRKPPPVSQKIAVENMDVEKCRRYVGRAIEVCRIRRRSRPMKCRTDFFKVAVPHRNI